MLLAANAVRALGELGLSEKVRRLGTPASAARILSWRGETLTDVPADELEKRLDAPSATEVTGRCKEPAAVRHGADR